MRAETDPAVVADIVQVTSTNMEHAQTSTTSLHTLMEQTEHAADSLKAAAKGLKI